MHCNPTKNREYTNQLWLYDTDPQYIYQNPIAIYHFEVHSAVIRCDHGPMLKLPILAVYKCLFIEQYIYYYYQAVVLAPLLASLLLHSAQIACKVLPNLR